MALLKFGPVAYIKYFILNSPMILAAFVILASAFNNDVKGLVFMVGALITMFSGSLMAAGIDKPPPDGIDYVACNMFSDSGWGVAYTSPGRNAVFLSYAATYLIASMLLNHSFHWGLLGLLIVIMVANASIRTKLLKCVMPVDILFGWSVGIFFALGWMLLIYAIQSKYDCGSLVYFSDEGSGDKCKLTNKKFRCRNI